MTPTLRTGRLVLSPYVPEDEDGFVALLADEDVSRWMGEGPETEETLRTLFGKIFTEVYAKHLFDVWAVRLADRYVGHAEIKRTGNVAGYEVVCALAREAWGRGLGAELAHGVVAYGFDVLGLTEVYGVVAAKNAASLVMARKIGFAHVRDIDNADGGMTHVLACRRRDLAGNSAGPGFSMINSDQDRNGPADRGPGSVADDHRSR